LRFDTPDTFQTALIYEPLPGGGVRHLLNLLDAPDR